MPSEYTDAARDHAEVLHRRRIEEALRIWPVDLIHCHGLDFAEHLPRSDAPVLVTLHLSAESYPAAMLRAPRRGTWFNCVSESQRRGFAASAAMLRVIDNGVPVGRLQARHARRGFALALGRICPEKGFHLALDAAALARIPLLIGGEVFPYEAHRRYFAQQIRPRLGSGARFLGSLGFARKRRLLTAARCLLVPSLCAETSSLVAMEAIACGTPVVAFPAGALADIVEPGVTGYLVGGPHEMAEAIHAAAGIDREHCRAVARRRFSQARMVERYFACYRDLAERRQPRERWFG